MEENKELYNKELETLNNLKNKLVSVIIPAYNREREVILTLNSVLDQTYNNIEIIVVNDGSTDNTETSVRNYISLHATSKLPIYYFWQKNGGLPAARNFGFSKAKGDYILYFDSDDTLLPERIEKQVRAMEEENANTCAAGFYRYKNGLLFKTELHDLYPGVNYINQILLKYKTGRGIMASTQSWMFTRERIEKVGGYDESLRSFQDIDICFRLHLLDDTKMAIVNEPLSIFNDDDNPNRIMKSIWKSPKAVDYRSIVIKKLLTNSKVLSNCDIFLNSAWYYINQYITYFINLKGGKWALNEWLFLLELNKDMSYRDKQKCNIYIYMSLTYLFLKILQNKYLKLIKFNNAK